MGNLISWGSGNPSDGALCLLVLEFGSRNGSWGNSEAKIWMNRLYEKKKWEIICEGPKIKVINEERKEKMRMNGWSFERN